MKSSRWFLCSRCLKNWKSSLRSRDAGALIHCIMCFLEKNDTWKIYVDLITILNFIKCRIVLKWNAFKHSINWMLDALSGRKQLRHGLGVQCLCEVARSLCTPLDICLWWHDQTSPNSLRHGLCAERVYAKRQSILQGNACIALILCIHQKSYKLDDGIMLIFVSWKNRPLLLAFGEGCTVPFLSQVPGFVAHSAVFA